MEWYILALIAAFLSAISTLIHKKVLIKQHAMEFATVLAIMNVILSFSIINYVEFSIPTNLLFYIFIAGFLGTFALLYLSKAMRHMQISSAVPLTNVSPAIIAILSFFILKEAISGKQIFAMGLIMIGAYVLEVDHKLSNLKEPFIKIWKSKYIHYIFLGVSLYAFTAIIERYLLTHGISPFTYTFVVQIFIMINFIFLITIFHDGLQGVKRGLKKNWKWLLLLSALTLTNKLVLFHAFALAFVPLVISIKRISTLFSTIVGGELFHEKGLAIKTIACVITLVGVALMILW